MTTQSAPARHHGLDEPPAELLYRHKVSLLRGVRDVWRAREIVRSLVERQFRTRYKQAMLGFSWSVVTPLILMVAFTFVFRRVAKVDTDGMPYQLFSYLGLLAWTFFSSSLSAAMNSLITQLSLINKVFCPREVFPISSVILAGIDTALATLALIVLFATNGVTPGVMAVWTPVLVLVVVATTTGWALLVSVWTVYVRDVRQALPLMLQLGLFATPVAYGFEKIPAGVRPAYSVLNPLAPVIDGLRRTLLQNRAPDLELLGLAAVGAGFVLSAGYYLFKRLEVNVVDVA